MAEAKATLKNLKIAPRKVRLVSDSIKGLHVKSALAELQMMPQRSTGPITKLVKSAMANAKEQKLDEDKLVIKKIEVNKGVTLKRAKPRARGRATLIEKKMSHITLLLEESDKAESPGFVIHEKQKEDKKKKPKREEKPKFKQEDMKQESAKRGFRDRVFRRKSV